jgi:hypothetical protein
VEGVRRVPVLRQDLRVEAAGTSPPNRIMASTT